MLKRLILALERLFEPPFTLDIVLTPDGKPPTRAYEDAAAYDLYAAEGAILPPQSHRPIRLGICTKFPSIYAGLMWDRSGMAKSGYTKFGGCIDADYTGEWSAIIYNSTNTHKVINPGDKIIQVVFQRKEVDKRDPRGYKIVDQLPKTARGDKGFNSTGNA
jgi:dUTP pyrophosphatase